MIVEDNDDDMFYFKRILRKSGLENKVVTFQDPRTAVAYLDAECRVGIKLMLPLIIFCDYNMPGLTGLQLIEWVKAQPALKSTYPVVLCGPIDQNLQQRLVAAGAERVLAKFPTPEAIRPLLEQAGCTLSELQR